MKKLVLSLIGCAGLLGSATEARAQAGLLVPGITAGIGLLRMAGRNKNKAAEAPATAGTSTYRGQQFAMQRTPADQLPRKGAAEVTAVETQLNQFHTALLADSTSALCTPEQRTAIQTALVSLARARPGWNLQPYQQEATFYLAEDARRQRGATPAR